MHRLERCPGCVASFAPFEGATHPNIGASAACWALHAAVLAGVEPSAELLTTSSVSAVRVHIARAAPQARALVLDAYAAQHHGTPSPQAIQSVAVHLLVLHGVLARGVSVDAALWIRRQAVRKRGVYAWLTPPEPDRALALRHCFPGAEIAAPYSFDEYVSSVHDAWQALHGQQLAHWYETFVAA
ncbi:MAG: DUF5946 family protein [Gemmatimonadaceae bacterium]|nr:DUF5946 family protein [Gemmatimonadaceae bacterium]